MYYTCIHKLLINVGLKNHSWLLLMQYSIYFSKLLCTVYKSLSVAPLRFWLGVELDTANGRNDGSVNGVRYFSSRSNHGIFMLSSKVKR